MTRADSGTTGRYLVLLAADAAASGAREISDTAGLRTVSTAELGGASSGELLGAADGFLLHELGVAVVTAAADQVEALNRAAGRGAITLVEPERVVHALATPQPGAGPDESESTWGLRAVGATGSAASGAGVRVAVLDTGVDATHPDLTGRVVVTNSFVQGEDAHDGAGHGTHVIGTACGPRDPGTGPGYGVAHEAEIYAGKVLSNQGSGTDGDILAGISWAVGNSCAVVSMSLGAATQPGDPYSRTFEEVAARALRRGTLIVAAAGNESRRSEGHVAGVGHPANCPSIMAVGAVDVRDAVADFSCGTLDAHAAVDIVAPGVDVYSSAPMPQRYQRLDGTSMATPHVAGVAALLAQQHEARGWELWARLAQQARRLPLPATDVGAGLVQAP
jgi:subtilisin family serine protease